MSIIKNQFKIYCLLFYFLTSMAFNLNAQDSILIKTKYRSGYLKEVYYSTKELKDFQGYIKNGPYKLYYTTTKKNFKQLGKNQELLIKETGYYKYGFKHGFWQEFHPPTIVMGEVFPPKIKNEGDYIGGRKIGEWRNYNAKGEVELKNYRFSIKYTGHYLSVYWPEIENDDFVVVSYHIDSTCWVSDIKFLKTIGKGLDEYALFKSIEDRFEETFTTIHYDTNANKEVSFNYKYLWDKEICVERDVVDTLEFRRDLR